jgi:hypothetical protein
VENLGYLRNDNAKAIAITSIDNIIIIVAGGLNDVVARAARAWLAHFKANPG